VCNHCRRSYTGGGRKNAKRWFGFVVRKTDTHLILRKCDTGKQAIKAGEKWAKDHKPEPSEVDLAIARVNSEGAIVAPPSVN